MGDDKLEVGLLKKTYAIARAVPNEVNDVNYFAAMMSSGKIKRRSCYECGEKGHLSTACHRHRETVNARPPFSLIRRISIGYDLFDIDIVLSEFVTFPFRFLRCLAT
ncbi:hypothetical protein DY000_02055340 [Brassica cretica]|uniref:CCHC-type domain-containing protein n=1 Tax=Brassica cretica TaxID=69181 RepID=A0ABQ7AFR5_BRACR|nr:hypothetical protein DY000_02055340 [Brassica cretica]